MAVLSRIGVGTIANDGTGDTLRTAGGKINAHIDLPGEIVVGIDGGGTVITTGLKGYLSVPFDGTITEAKLLANQSGSIVVDIWKCTYAQFDAGATHPVTPGDKITASAPPTISSATKSTDTTLSGWTLSFASGDVFAFNVNSVTTIQRVTLSLKFTK